MVVTVNQIEKIIFLNDFVEHFSIILEQTGPTSSQELEEVPERVVIGVHKILFLCIC